MPSPESGNSPSPDTPENVEQQAKRLGVRDESELTPLDSPLAGVVTESNRWRQTSEGVLRDDGTIHVGISGDPPVLTDDIEHLAGRGHGRLLGDQMQYSDDHNPPEDVTSAGKG